MLLSAGVNLNGWWLEAAVGVSDDGMTVFGDGSYFGQSRPWMVVVPAPSASVPIFVALVLASRRRRRSLVVSGHAGQSN